LGAIERRKKPQARMTSPAEIMTELYNLLLEPQILVHDGSEIGK
jgi:hypothetical protein